MFFLSTSIFEFGTFCSSAINTVDFINICAFLSGRPWPFAISSSISRNGSIIRHINTWCDSWADQLLTAHTVCHWECIPVLAWPLQCLPKTVWTWTSTGCSLHTIVWGIRGDDLLSVWWLECRKEKLAWSEPWEASILEIEQKTGHCHLLRNNEHYKQASQGLFAGRH